MKPGLRVLCSLGVLLTVSEVVSAQPWSIRARVRRLERTVVAQAQRITTLEQRVTTLGQTVVSLQAAASSTSARLGAVESALRYYSVEVDCDAGVIAMPPMYVNVGAYVDEGSMIDSHALVGSCAQVGKRVHVSAGAQIGGVLEPVGALPVCVEDDVLHMNAVDTGWITDEDPFVHASRKREELGFQPPLDVVDGAARVLDPYLSGLNSGLHQHGEFFKDYAPSGW